LLCGEIRGLLVRALGRPVRRLTTASAESSTGGQSSSRGATDHDSAADQQTDGTADTTRSRNWASSRS
jgi:hypothetical protein